MIKITDYDGRPQLLNVSTIARVITPSASSMYRGTRSIIKMMDGTTIESQDEVSAIESMIEEDLRCR